MNKQIQNLALSLHDIGAIKFGEFKLKSGIMSPVYIDLRLIVSYPEILQSVADAMWEKVHNADFDIVCGVPYTALPIATAMSLKNNVPMIMRRKEVKDYGTKKVLEGVFEPGQTCLIIEDLITSGSSVFETIEPIEHESLKVKDIVILVDREQGGKKHIEDKGYTLHSVLTISEILTTLQNNSRLDESVVENVKQFIQDNQT